MTPRKKAPKAKVPPDAAPRTKWTRAEAEAHVRGLGLSCRGPVVPHQQALWQQLMNAGKTDAARLIPTRGVPDPDGNLKPCGHNIGEEVAALPFDGTEQGRACPKCGTMNNWRQPVFDGLDESKQKRRKP